MTNLWQAAQRDWVGGEYPTAAIFNAHFRDQMKTLGDAWDVYTPVWSATGTAPVIGNGSVSGKVRQVGKAIDFRAIVTAGSTSTFGSGTLTLTLPTAPLAGRALCRGVFFDNSPGAHYNLHGFFNGTTTVQLLLDPTTAGAAFRAMTATAPVTLATGDEIVIFGQYEAA